MRGQTESMIVTLTLGLSLVLGGSACAIEMATGRQLSMSGSDRATRYVQSNKIVSLNGKTHFSWLDWGASTTKASSYDELSETWSGTAVLGTGMDNHGGPAIAIDSEGYLHAIFGPHHGPFKYAKSASPNDASSWIQQSSFSSDATYPSFVIDSNDAIHLTYRRSNGDPWKLNYQRLPKGGSWTAPTILAQPPNGYSGYSHFHNSMSIGPNDELNLLYDIYYTTPNPDAAPVAGHLKSVNGGLSWQTVDGTPLTQPATPSSNVFFRTTTVDHGLGTNNIVTDSQGNIWLTMYEYNQQGTTDAYLYHHNGQQWQSTKVRDLLPPEAASFGISSDLTIGLDGNDGIYLAGIIDGGIGVLHGSDLTGPYEYLSIDPRREDFFPYGVSIERSVGHNDIDEPWIMYSAGHGGVNGVQSDVFAVRLTDNSSPLTRYWDTDGGGAWSDKLNWYPRSSPVGNNAIVVFGPDASVPGTAIIDTNVTVNRIEFDNPNTHAVAGLGSLSLDTDPIGAIDPSIEVLSGDHQIQVEVNLLDDTTVTVNDGSLAFNNIIDLAGNTLNVTGMVEFNHSVIDSVGHGAISNSGILAANSMLIAGDLVSDGTLDIDITHEEQPPIFNVIGSADLEGTIDIDIQEGVVPTDDIVILTATAGINLTGSLSLMGSDARFFKGVRVDGNNLLLDAIARVPEPEALSLFLLNASLILSLRKDRCNYQRA